MEEINVLEKEKVKGRDLVDLVLSWSIHQVLNQNLYRGQVNKIPETFMSTSQYMKAFIPPLIEEMRAELLSSVQLLPRAPVCEVSIVGPCNDCKPPNDLFYRVSLIRPETRSGTWNYDPLVGDLILLSDVRPTCVDDLKRNYVTAFVYRSAGGNSSDISILSSKPIEECFIMNRQMQSNNGRGNLFGVYLINMTTNIRIWNALNSKLEGNNMSLIQKILKSNCWENEACSICSMNNKNSIALSKRMENLSSFNLNKSQEEAVLSCINAVECFHQNTVKLIWGPPGTGKTETVSILLCSLFQMKCRTLTCAPTNIAVVEAAARVRKSLVEIVGCETCGVGDIVLFGNRERMKIGEQNDVLDVFLDFRVKILQQCFSQWSNCLTEMINLLDKPAEQHCYYVLDNLFRKNEKDNIDEPEEAKKCCKLEKKKKARSNEKEEEVQVEDDHSKSSTNSEEKSELLTLEDFVQKRFTLFKEKLEFCITSLYTHLPTSCIPLKVVKNMIQAAKLLKSLEAWLFSAKFVNGGLKEILEECGNVFNTTRIECVNLLRMLPQEFTCQNLNKEAAIRKFCLSNACLLFCTASSSVRLHAKDMEKLECVVIDEAAQLKECETLIPLQLNGLRLTILVGDERQLSAMVNSLISKEAGFGRSLFERMVNLGHKSHLLNIQYRMHPSISKFPNAEFYGNRISDAENVQQSSHHIRFLKKEMYGNYSFINIAHGQEELDDTRSLKNVVEVAAVADLVSRLFYAFNQTKKKFTIGIITPYKAQVFAIQEMIAKHSCTDSDANFIVNVRSVDGFQGGEEDVIIISTVRCNRNGEVGFLSDEQRANVALTRARYCLWILGNEETLVKSGSIWKNIVEDAKVRGCFYDATEDKSLAKAISLGLLQLDQFDLDAVLTMDSAFYGKDTARWKVCLTDEFRASMTRIKNVGTRQEVISLLGKLTSGWRQSKTKQKAIENDGVCWQVMELYEVNEKLVMAWSVDIVMEGSYEVQVLKIWDVLTSSDIPKMVKRFDQVIRNYAVNKIHRCRHKSMDGNLVVPMIWEMDASSSTSDDLNLQPISLQPNGVQPFQPIRVKPNSVQPVKPNSVLHLEPVSVQPISVQPFKPVSVQPISLQPSKPVSVQPFKPVSVQPSKPVSVQPSKPVSIQPSKPVSVQPSKPVSVQPIRVQPIGVQPVKPICVQPLKVFSVHAFKLASVKPISVQPFKLVSVQPISVEAFKPVSLQAFKSVSVQPSVQPFSFQPVEPICVQPFSVQPFKLVSVQPFKPVILQPFKSVSVQPISVQSFKFVCPQPFKPVSVQPIRVQPVSVQPVNPIRVQPFSIQTFKPFSVQPFKLVSVQAFDLVSVQVISGQPSKPVSVQHVKPVSVQAFKLLSVQPIKPISVQPISFQLFSVKPFKPVSVLSISVPLFNPISVQHFKPFKLVSVQPISVPPFKPIIGVESSTNKLQDDKRETDASRAEVNNVKQWFTRYDFLGLWGKLQSAVQRYDFLGFWGKLQSAVQRYDFLGLWGKLQNALKYLNWRR